jgi:hypothetical protein
MMDSVARNRLLALLPEVSGKLERFLATSDPFPVGIVEFDAVAGYLGDMGLKPDGEWLLREFDLVLQQGFALVECERWAKDPEAAARLGYSVQYSKESEEMRDTRRTAILGMAQGILKRLRELLRLLCRGKAVKFSSTGKATKHAGPGRQAVGDQDEERRFYDDWKASARALKDFAKARGVKVAEAEAHTARERTRRNRARQKNSAGYPRTN